MAKYSFEFKKQFVMEFLSGQGGISFLSKKYKLSSYQLAQNWIRQYLQNGDRGLLRVRENKKYPLEYKLHVVELYMTGEMSYSALAAQECITSPSLIVNWVQAYRKYGIEGLTEKKPGRDTMPNSATKIPKTSQVTEAEDAETNLESEYVKTLEAENLRLRIENAYLKELRRLRLEEETLHKELQE